ncbi:MAG: hypothetical protein JST35_04455 [Armatimonadetes bacterium]|nr:hypothetical protein [Armatimonadota bacterium]
MLASVLLALQVPTAAFEVRSPAFGNLTYQLDVVAGLLPWENPAAYKALWDKEFLATAEDKAALDSWRRARAVRQPARKPGGVNFPLEDLSVRNDPDNAARGAGFEASDPTDYAGRMKPLVGDKQSEELLRVANRFWPKFCAWWDKEAKAPSEVFREKMAKLLERPKITDTVAQFMAFYKPERAAKGPLKFVMLFKPGSATGDSSGQQLGPYSVVQFRAGEDPNQRVDIVLHELCHYLYNSGPLSAHARLQQDFLDSKQPGAIPCFNLLDEALATALGNGVLVSRLMKPEGFAQYLAAPMSFYGRPDIDGAAKATFGWIRDWLASGKSLFAPGFAESYITAARQRLGADLERPMAYFSRMFLIQDKAFGPAPLMSVRNELSVASLSASMTDFQGTEAASSLKANPNMPTLVLVTPQHASRVEALGLGIKKPLSPGVFCAWRNRWTPAVVIVAGSQTEADRLVAELARMPDFKAFKG